MNLLKKKISAKKTTPAIVGGVSPRIGTSLQNKNFSGAKALNLDADIPDAVSLALGQRIKALRTLTRISLDELSRSSNVSRAMLSKVERGEKSPTLPVIVRIASGFGISLSALLGAEPDQSEVVVIKQSQRLTFRDQETGFERWVLSPAHVDNGVEIVQHRLPAGRSTGVLPPYSTPTEKYLTVIEGHLTVFVDNKPYVLDSGDSIYFEVKSTYRFKNEDHTKACNYYMAIVRKRSFIE